MNQSFAQVMESEFPLLDDIAYLNHAAVAPWPRRTYEAVTAFARENLETGALYYPRWSTVERQLRQQLAELIQAPSADDIALLKNTSEALSMVAYGLEWSFGDNIVTSDQEFPANRVVWESLAKLGVETRRVSLDTHVTPEDALIARCNANTRLLTVSSVQYATGLRMDLARLGKLCAERNILFCIDAIQSIGALAINVQHIQADFVMADGHKWMLGPEGVALFYCREKHRTRLKLHEYGWHMVEHRQDYDAPGWQPATSARRFECGSPNMLGIHALAASLSLIQEIGIPEIEKRVLKNSRYLFDRIATLPGFSLVTSPEEGRFGGIVTCRHDKVSAEQLYERLSAAKVVCAKRGGGIRFSPHFYTAQTRLDKALNVLAEFS